MGSHFAMDFPECASYYGVDRVLNELTGEFDSVSPSTLVYPVFEGMAMGWSWALYFCHSTVSKAAAGGCPQLAADRRPGSTPTLTSAIRCPCVDNANFIRLNEVSAQKAVDEAERDLKALGLIVHEKGDAKSDLTLIGIDFCGSTRRLRLTHKRAWRLHFGLLDFCRWRKAPGWIVRVLVGHVVNAFQLLRWGMSVLDRVYRFIADHLNEWVIARPM